MPRDSGEYDLMQTGGRFLVLLFNVIPGLLLWLVTFSTITLPTWLFSLFSSTLTFTMNFTTL